MRSGLEATLPWWIAGPILGLVIVTLLGLANKRFGVVGGVTDLLHGSAEGRGLRSWRTVLVGGIVLGGLGYAALAGWPDAGSAYSWLDPHLSAPAEAGVLFGAGLLIGVGARTAGGLHLRARADRRSAGVAGEHRVDDDEPRAHRCPRGRRARGGRAAAPARRCSRAGSAPARVADEDSARGGCPMTIVEEEVS